MKNFPLTTAVAILLCCNLHAQHMPEPELKFNAQYNPTRLVHSILPFDGIVPYLPFDTSFVESQMISSEDGVHFIPKINFFFRPENTNNYKEAGLPIDTGHLNFYLRGDIGGKITLPKDIDMVFNLQSYGVYTRSLGPLDPNLSLYEAYVDMKSLDKRDRLSLRFGRMSLGKYGTEMLIGNDDFIKGRSFESVRLRYKTDRSTNDVMWVQLYQPAPDTAGFEWNHPIFLATLNTFNFSEVFNLDVNLPYIIDQYNSGFRTSVLMPDVRLFGQTGGIRYSAELIYQTGITRGVVADDKLGNLNAFAAEGSLGYYTTGDKFGVDLTYYRASGDDTPGDADIKSYNVLWQNEHRRFGFIDVFKGSNVQATTLHVNLRAGERFDTGLHGVMANVLEQSDRSTGIAVPGFGPIDTESTSIGIGGDWYLNYYLSHHLNMQLSASVFSPGDYFTEVSGLDKTMYRLYLLLALRV